MERCLLSIYIFRGSEERLSAYLPNGYQLASEGAAFSFWVYSCGDVVIDEIPAGPAMVSLVGIHVADPKGAASGMTLGLAGAQLYVPWVHSDNAALVAVLKSAGMPVRLVKGITHERLGPLSVSASVPWKHSPYQLSQPNDVFQDAPHGHDNSFWHKGRLGTTELQIEVTFPNFARDSACYGTLVECARVSARRGSAIGKLVGGESAVGDGVNHDEILRIEATLRRSP
ncbi:MAG: hypothetical protein M3N53_08005 [Actinomycetota bacterium]|nr:hypothetical protein [Actinomycetota bacterium]